MKTRHIKPTRSKTRKGVLTWLAKLNPFMLSEHTLYVSHVVAVHIHATTGAIHAYETASGHMFLAHALKIAA